MFVEHCMSTKKHILLLPFLFVFSFTQAQTDTIKVDEAVSVVLEKELKATELKTGDTIFVFRITDDVMVRSHSGKAVVAIKKDAPVAAVVVLSMVPHKVDKRHMDRYKPDTFEQRYQGENFWVTGVLTLKLVSVQAVDGSFLALNECPLSKVGGVNGGFKNDNIPASIQPGIRKVCRTQYPTAVLIIKD